MAPGDGGRGHPAPPAERPTHSSRAGPCRGFLTMQARRGSRALALALAPVLWTQGQRVHRGTPVLPEAADPPTGVCGSGGPCRLLVLGESTAAGVGASDHTSGLAGQLARALAERLGLEVSWQALGRSGYTAQRALSELVPRLEGSFDVIVVTLGVNDVLRLTSRTRWCHDVRALVAALHHHLSLRGRLVLAGVPRVDGMPALPQPTRAVLGLHARSLDTSLARIITPRTTVTHLPLPAFDDPEIFACDNLHPSPSATAGGRSCSPTT